MHFIVPICVVSRVQVAIIIDAIMHCVLDSVHSLEDCDCQHLVGM